MGNEGVLGHGPLTVNGSLCLGFRLATFSNDALHHGAFDPDDFEALLHHASPSIWLLRMPFHKEVFLYVEAVSIRHIRGGIDSSDPQRIRRLLYHMKLLQGWCLFAQWIALNLELYSQLTIQQYLVVLKFGFLRVVGPLVLLAVLFALFCPKIGERKRRLVLFEFVPELLDRYAEFVLNT